MVFAATLPDGPGVAAVTGTTRDSHVIVGTFRIATGRKSASSVANATPVCVRTSVPFGIV